MLCDNTAKGLGYEGNFNNYRITSIAFHKPEQIWNKGKTNSAILPQNKISLYHKHSFYKHGKTFGVQVSRYIEYHEGVLVYYDNQIDKQYKGYCLLQNLYMYYFPAGSHFVMHLTNGNDASTFHFPNNNFYKSIQSSIIRDVIQLNFRQKYQVGDMLGEGTFSKVYTVHNRVTNKKFAAKIIPKTDATGFQTRHIVQEQKKVLKRLNSQRVCKMEQFFQDTENYIFILQFLGGQDLNCFFRNRISISLVDAVLILKQTLKSLAQLHKRNIIHRDLKPHNILVNIKQKSIKLIDFGLSLVFNDKIELSKFMRCGTMGYIAPQVVNNSQANRKPYDTKSDMFGFGIIAHMVLMGSNPIRGKTYKETVDKNMKCQIQLDKKSILLKYGKDCLALLESLLSKDPKQRPTCEQALRSPFFQQKHKDEQTHMNSQVHDEQILHNHHGDQVNYIEDKQLLGHHSKLLKQEKQIMSPTKNTNASWRSMSISSKISGIR